MQYLLTYSHWKKIYEAANGNIPNSELEPIPVLPEESREKHFLNQIAADAYAKMVAAAEADGIKWGITDSYRTLEVQKRLAIEKGLYSQGGLAAKPGTSNHGWGSAVDLDFKQGSGDAAYAWLEKNAAKFGFSTIPREPWHWEHTESAKILKAKGSAQEVQAQSSSREQFNNVELTRHQERLVKRFIEKLKKDDSITKLIDNKEELINVAPEELTKLAQNLSITEEILELWISNQVNDSEFIEIIATRLVAAGLSRRERKQAVRTVEPVAQLADIASGQKILKLGSTGEDVRVIRQKLYDLGFMEEVPSDKFDQATDRAVREFQTEKKIRIDGIVGPETYGTLFGVAFDPNAERTKIEIVDGKIKSSYTGEKQNNINILINEMVKQGITNPYAQIGVLSVVGKETNYIPKSEIMNYSKERLPEVWGVFSKTGRRVPRGQGKFNYNDLAVEYENNPEKLANFVYGQKPHGMRVDAYGNTQPGDGWKYRGRGFNQVTFKGSYEELGREVGMDLVSNPDVLNSVNVAAEVAVKFLLNRLKEKRIDPNQFTSIGQAVETFARANAGWGNDASTEIASAMEKSKTFSVA